MGVIIRHLFPIRAQVSLRAPLLPSHSREHYNRRRGGAGLGKGPQTHRSDSSLLLASWGPQGQATSCQSVESGGLQSGELESWILEHREAQRDVCRRAGSELRLLPGPRRALSPRLMPLGVLSPRPKQPPPPSDSPAGPRPGSSPCTKTRTLSLSAARQLRSERAMAQECEGLVRLSCLHREILAKLPNLSCSGKRTMIPALPLCTGLLRESYSLLYGKTLGKL